LDGRRWLQLLDDDDANVQLPLPSFLFSGRRRDGLGLSPLAATADRIKRMRPIFIGAS
jgi:hypothetical protein